VVSPSSVAVDSTGDSLPTTTMGLDRRRIGSFPPAAEIGTSEMVIAIVSDVSSAESSTVSSTATFFGVVFFGVAFFGVALFGVVLFCLFGAVGVSSASSSLFPTVFLADPLRGVEVGSCPGVSVPRRVVTIVTSRLCALAILGGDVSLGSLEASWTEGERLRMRLALLKICANMVVENPNF
jgi:hypothetical protein